MNEHDVAKNIARQLNAGLGQMDETAVARLQAARKQALEKYRAPQPVFGLAWAGGFQPHSRHTGHTHLRWWLSAGVLMLALLAALFWQSSQKNGDIADIDAALLSGDLPIHAYLDQEFDTWLDSSSR
jgi:hypothetical protein